MKKMKVKMKKNHKTNKKFQDSHHFKNLEKMNSLQIDNLNL